MARPLLRDPEAASFIGTFWLLAALTIVLLVGPTVIVLVTSFTDAETLKFPPDRYSLRWYRALLDSGQMLDAAYTSFKVAIIVTAASAVLGTLAASVIARSRAAWARALDTLFMSPLVLPAIAYGLATIIFLGLMGVRLSITTLVIGHIVVCVPYVMRTVSASMQELDAALLESAASLGATRTYAFRTVVLPLVARGIGAGSFIAFMASFDNVPVSLFLSDARTEVLPIRMWQVIEASLDVRVAAISGVLIVATLLLMLAMERFSGLSKRLS